MVNLSTMRQILVVLVSLVAATLLVLSCNNNHEKAQPTVNSGTESSTIADFPSLESSAWVNGTPVSLTDARGKNVVLIEAWHPA
jgi:hypothetical protein